MVRLLLAAAALSASLLLQAALGQWVPQGQRYVDAMLWPLAWYALAGSQRSAMIVGCCAGLLQDAWFQSGVFGVHGISKTLLGWALGGLGARFELNHVGGRAMSGGLLFALDRFLEMGLLRLLGLAVARPSWVDLAVGAAVNASLVVLVFAVLGRFRRRDDGARPPRWR